MAKLAPKDPQFGIPVAARIRKDLAFRFNSEAARAGKSLSRYISEYLENICLTEKRVAELNDLLKQEKIVVTANGKLVSELQAQLINERETAKRVAGKFIMEITEGNQKKAIQLIQTFNKINQNERGK